MADQSQLDLSKCFFFPRSAVPSQSFASAASSLAGGVARDGSASRLAQLHCCPMDQFSGGAERIDFQLLAARSCRDVRLILSAISSQKQVSYFDICRRCSLIFNDRHQDKLPQLKSQVPHLSSDSSIPAGIEAVHLCHPTARTESAQI